MFRKWIRFKNLFINLSLFGTDPWASLNKTFFVYINYYEYLTIFEVKEGCDFNGQINICAFYGALFASFFCSVADMHFLVLFGTNLHNI